MAHGKKIYLNSFDYTAGLLNYMCRFTPGHGNHFLLVLESDEKFHGADITGIAHLLAEKTPFLNGRIKRNLLNLAPYWKEGKGASKATAFRTVFKSLAEHRSFTDAITEYANTPLPEQENFELAVFEKLHSSYLVFKFSHLLFDGRGAEILLNALEHSDSELIARSTGSNSPELNRWITQFSAGKKVNRKIISICRTGKIAKFQAPQNAQASFRTIELSKTESEALLHRAESESGPFMLTPYLLSLAVRAMTPILRKHVPDENILAHMSLDLRGTNGIPDNTIFFNQWSLLPLLIPHENICDPLPTLKTAFFRENAEQIPLAFRNAAYLSRIAPYPILEKIFTRTCEGNFTGTFMFSFISGSSLRRTEFTGGKIRNLLHIPLMPPAPGLGFFFSEFHGYINLVISYRKGVLSESDISYMEHNLSTIIKGNAL